MSSTREQLEALNEQLLKSGTNISAVRLRAMVIALVQSLLNIIDDKDQEEGYVAQSDFAPGTIAAFNGSGKLISLDVTIEELLQVIQSGGYNGDPSIIDQDDNYRFVTTGQINNWDSKEVGGAAAAAETSAKSYADDLVSDLEDEMNTALAGKEDAGAAAQALQDAKDYTDAEIATLQTYVDTGLASKEVIGTADALVLIPFNANEDCPAFELVTSNGNLADSGNAAHRGKVIGINTAAVLNGFVGKAKGIGSITNPAWTWTIGDKIFLNGTALSTIDPSSGFSQMIGVATAADKIDIQIQSAIKL